MYQFCPGLAVELWDEGSGNKRFQRILQLNLDHWMSLLQLRILFGFHPVSLPMLGFLDLDLCVVASFVVVVVVVY